MIGYLMVGTNNVADSGVFYDTLLTELGGSRMWETDRIIVWSFKEGPPHFSVTLPFDGNEACVGNGSMIALSAPSNEVVDKVYALAMAGGARDEGKPGPRGEDSMGFYAGYFRDPDGNKLNVFHMEAQD